MTPQLAIYGIVGMPEIMPGDALSSLILEHLPIPLADGDILIVASKAVSKAEGHVFDKRDIIPSEEALRLCPLLMREPEYIELALRESERIVKLAKGVMICRTRHGFVLANAGVDASNAGGENKYIALPLDPDESARRLREEIRQLSGQDVGIIISDTFGRAWRRGQTDLAIGCAGVGAFVDYAGMTDRDSKPLRHSLLACADELAGAAELVMGKSAGIPAALVRGADLDRAKGDASGIPYPTEDDLFLSPGARAVDFFDVIGRRHSVRSYLAQPLPEGCVEELLRAAASAPSAHNAQPWHFAVCASQEAKQRLLRHTSASYRRMLQASSLPPETVEARIAQAEAYFTNIPVLIVVFMTPPAQKHAPDIERTLALQSVSAAVTQLLLAAQAKGLGACWHSLPLFCGEQVRQAAGGLPEWEPMALVTVGYEDGRSVQKKRRGLETLYTVL